MPGAFGFLAAFSASGSLSVGRTQDLAAKLSKEALHRTFSRSSEADSRLTIWIMESSGSGMLLGCIKHAGGLQCWQPSVLQTAVGASGSYSVGRNRASGSHILTKFCMPGARQSHICELRTAWYHGCPSKLSAWPSGQENRQVQPAAAWNVLITSSSGSGMSPVCIYSPAGHAISHLYR